MQVVFGSPEAIKIMLETKHLEAREQHIRQDEQGRACYRVTVERNAIARYTYDVYARTERDAQRNYASGSLVEADDLDSTEHVVVCEPVYDEPEEALP
jgi:hypothetical protein